MTPIIPTFSPELQALVRSAYAALMLLTLLAALPHARRYFFGERWGGFTESGTLSDALQNPPVASLLVAAWMAANVAMLSNHFVVQAAALNLLCCYYFFNRLRWTSLSRGMGAPGFIALWLGAAVFLLELASRHAPDVRGLVLLTLQLDFGAVMLSAGLYKLAAGYRQRSGMELGMVNPEWGYWPSFWKTWPPQHPLFRFFNEMAWSTEVLCGLLMLIPATRSVGGAVMLLSFIFIASQIRLGFLPEMVMVCCLLFFAEGTLVDTWAVAAVQWAGVAPATAGALMPSWAQQALAAVCVGYLVLLPLVRAAMFYNQLRHRSLPRPLQRGFDAYANLVGLILWRVFTADVVNFFVRVWEVPASGARRLVSDYKRTGPSRYSQVAECIAITSVFTTLKYFPGNAALFEDKLRRYARTVPREAGSQLVFEWVSVLPGDSAFEFVPVAEFTIDASLTHITETVLSTVTTPRAIPQTSPVHEGARPGSYAPLQR